MYFINVVHHWASRKTVAYSTGVFLLGTITPKYITKVVFFVNKNYVGSYEKECEDADEFHRENVAWKKPDTESIVYTA